MLARDRRSYRQHAPHFQKKKVAHHGKERAPLSSGQPAQTDRQARSREGKQNSLFLALCERQALREAWRAIRKGRSASARRWTGAADRVSFELYERRLERNITRLRYDLLNGRYRPDPVNNFRIPKPGGSFRTLTVLTIRDRLVQRAALELVAPLFEPDFLPCSYGFRPERGREAALAEIERACQEGFGWVADADIEAFFDNIDRGRLVRLLREKISDPRLVALLKMWLNHPAGEEWELSLPVEAQNTIPVNAPADMQGRPALLKRESGLVEKLARFSRAALEGGLEWGISSLDKDSYSPYYTYGTPERASPLGRWDAEDEEEEARAAGPGSSRATGSRPFHPEEDEHAVRETLKRLGMDSALAGLWLAKGFLRRKAFGLTGEGARAGVALGTAATLGILAHRVWKKRQTRSGGSRAEEEPAETGDGLVVPRRRRGIAQGSVLSPLYSNIYLHEFDRRISERNYRLVRFADDLVILCRSRSEAEEALAFAELVIVSLGLSFKPSKTEVRPLAEGYRFLGATMGPKGKWTLTAEADPRKGTGAVEGLRLAGAGWFGKAVARGPGVVQKGRRFSRQIFNRAAHSNTAGRDKAGAEEEA